MEELDTSQESDLHHDEDELFLNHVVQDDHELYFLDVCMNEICKVMQESGS